MRRIKRGATALALITLPCVAFAAATTAEPVRFVCHPKYSETTDNATNPPRKSTRMSGLSSFTVAFDKTADGGWKATPNFQCETLVEQRVDAEGYAVTCDQDWGGGYKMVMSIAIKAASGAFTYAADYQNAGKSEMLSRMYGTCRRTGGRR